LSRSNHGDDIPPIFKLILGAIVEHIEYSGDGGDGAVHKSREAHQEWHQEKIRYWESIRDHLTEKFGEVVSADMREMQRMAARACNEGQSGFSSLIGAVDDLMVISGGDQRIMMMAARLIHDITEKTMVIRRVEDLLKDAAEVVGKAKTKPNSKSKSEPGTKAKGETKAEARARIRAEAEAARLREQAESN
jgi:hypothetical protein